MVWWKKLTILINTEIYLLLKQLVIKLFEFIEKKRSLEDSIELLKKILEILARRQLTWFRRYEDAKWFDLSEQNEISKYIESSLNFNK